MYYVYILKSINYNNQIYIGYTNDITDRLAHHNRGKSFHTDKYKPWEIIFYSAFLQEQKAIEFEKYLKSGSGLAFRNKRLL